MHQRHPSGMSRHQGHSSDLPHSRPQRKKRRSLTTAEKNCIYRFREENPLVTHANIAATFGIERSTVSKIMHDFDRGLNPIGEEFHSAWTPRPQASITNHASMAEVRLLEWVIEARRAGINVTRNMIRAQAARFAIEAQTHSPLDPGLSPILELPSRSSHQDVHEATPIFTSGMQNPTNFPYQASSVGPRVTNSDIDLLAANLHDSILAHQDQWPLASLALTSTTSSFATTHDEHLFSTLGQPNTSNSSFGNDAMELCQTHSTTTCANVNPDKMGAICPSNVRYAFNIVESYISDSPSKTALDQLCLNHVKAILDR